MNFLFLMNSSGVCAWRVWPIKRALEQEGHQVIALNNTHLNDDVLARLYNWTDVLTMQMVSAKYLVEEAKKKGIYTIFDCDDILEWTPPSHPFHKKNQQRSFKKLFFDQMKKVDLITVASNPLYERYKFLNKNIEVLPNYLPDYFWEKLYNPNTSRWLRLGWAGGISHQEDLDFIAPVIKKILKKYPKVKFVYSCGGGWKSGHPDDEVIFGENQFGEIPLERKEYNAGSRVEVWPDRLNTMQLDIALAPLANNQFAKSKTHIKYFEYAINRWAGIYQKFLYSDVVKHGKTGFLATTPSEWEAYIELLIKDPSLRSEIGKSAYGDVKNHYTFDRNRGRWLKVYRYAGQTSTGKKDEFFVSRR